MNLDFNKICRACLTKRGRMHDISSAKIQAMIESCSAIAISEADNLPKKICDNCFRRLINSNSLKNMIQRNDTILRGYLKNKLKSNSIAVNLHTRNRNNTKLNSEPPPLVPISAKIAEFTCSICLVSFSDRSLLLLHLPTHVHHPSTPLPRTVVKRHECHLCHKRYSTGSSLRLHTYAHTGERPHQCPICGKRFVRWAAVASHMVTHSGQRAHACSVCGRGFKVRSNMERHKVLHMGIALYCCNFCGKTFSQSNNLTVHTQTYHTMERLHLCNICGKRFVCSSRLKRHIRIHNRTEKLKK